MRARVSHLLDFGGMSHQIKAGFGFEDTEEDLTRVANGWGTIAFVIVAAIVFTNLRWRRDPDEFTAWPEYATTAKETRS